MRKSIKIFLLPAFFLFSVSLFSGDLAFRHLDNRDGLSQVNILSIYQDETGAMWFGSTEGLNYYDGQKIRIFRPSQDGSGLSQNEIYKLCGNRKGAMYIKAKKDLVKYDLYKQRFINLRKNDVNDMYHYHDTLWIAAGRQILFHTGQTDSLHLFFKSEANIPDLKIYIVDNSCILAGYGNFIYEIPKNAPGKYKTIYTENEITVLFKDRKNNTWIGTDKNGVYRITPDNDSVHYTQADALSDNQIRCIIEDNSGNIWVGTFYGLNKYDTATNKWTTYTQRLNNEYSLSHNSIFALYKDEQGTIWIGTYFGGINYFNPDKDRYSIYGADFDDIFSVSYPFVGNMTEDQAGNLWICTEGGGLNYFDRQKQTFTKYLYNDKNPAGIGHNNLKCIRYDRNNEKLYVGTHTGGLSIMDIRRKTFKTLKHRPGDKYSLPNNIVNAMQYYRGCLILLTSQGLVKMNLQRETFSEVTENRSINSILNKLYTYETFLIDSQDRIWLSLTTGGLVRIDMQTGKIKEYSYNLLDKASIGRFKVIKIFENSQRRLFFGTAGSGLFEYKPENDSFINYTAANKELMSDYCYYIAELPYKFLIILHSRGATFFDFETNKLQYTYEFSQQNFSQGSSIYIAGDNEIFFGGNNGLASISDRLLSSSSNDLKMYFNRLIVNNKEILPDDDTGILDKAISFSEEIKLKHNQNNLIINFTTTEYVPVNYHNYTYRLEGFDEKWIAASSSHQITYTNLDPGKYRLRLCALKENDTFAAEISMLIHISPPFYASAWAYAAYTLLLILSLYFAIHFRTKQAKLKASLEFERKDKERIEILNKTKLQFFTNISHEFRTPLTLIMGQSESLLGDGKLSPYVYNCLLRVYKNAMHLRNLITELLDFRKQEQGFLDIKAEKTNIVAFTKEIYMSFYEYALKKNIRYTFEYPEKQMDVWFDTVQMQKVIYNLLSNAFKYTGENGEISVTFKMDENAAQILITDTGIGIACEYLDKIFDRFYQVEPDNSFGITMGTGIGLALSKGIVELHKGSIRVESELHKGSTFIVVLPLGDAHFTAEQLKKEDFSNGHITGKPNTSNFLQQTADMPAERENDSPENEKENKKPVMLAVDDNTELLDMLEDIFSPFYRVYRALNGKEGLERVMELQPDIILSDVMMPEMTGKEMCCRIKNDVAVSHIPVVLLTAQTSVEHTVEGYMFGADDYITKPFNIRILVSRCNNLVNNRKILLEKMRNHAVSTLADAHSTNEYDRKLIENVVAIIRANFENSEFNMDLLASQLGMGRSKLYAKIKEITGFTPNEFTLKLKMEESMKLLNNCPHLGIAEISYMIGFSSARYFSQSFKSFYGVAPANARKSKSD